MKINSADARIFLSSAPRWLISNGRLAEGQRVVAALEPAAFDSEQTILQTRVILESLEGSAKQKKSDLLTNGPTQHFRRMMIGSSSQMWVPCDCRADRR